MGLPVLIIINDDAVISSSLLKKNQYIIYVAYRLDLFEEGCFTNMFILMYLLFKFKALQALRLEDFFNPSFLF
jgi:ribulose 1,5-bisphosphate carboxylase large subunit-like protein